MHGDLNMPHISLAIKEEDPQAFICDPIILVVCPQDLLGEYNNDQPPSLIVIV